MGKTAEMRINLTDEAGVSAPVLIARYRHALLHLIPDPDASLSIGSGIAKLQYSADGENFFDTATTLTNSAPGTTTAVDVTGVYAIRMKTSTANGSSDPNALTKVYLI